MGWNAGTATDYLDMLQQLVELMTSNHMTGAVINAAGTGYVVGDTLDIDNTGSTRTHDAQIEVLTVGGSGEITAARIWRAGAYTVNPSTLTGNAASGGTGTGATFDLTFEAAGWITLRRTQEAVSATVANGGTGYTVGDQLTIVDDSGTLQDVDGVDAVFNVDTVSGGVVTAVSLVTAGNYEKVPTNPAATSGGTGTGCTLNVTYQDAASQDRQVVVLQGEGFSGTDEILAAVKTYDRLNATGFNTVRNWALFGLRTWNDNLRLFEQSVISPGFDTTPLDGTIEEGTNGGAFVPLKPSTAFDIQWWVSVTPNRVAAIFRVEDASNVHYPQMSFGFLNRAGTSVEKPYPMYVMGASTMNNVWYLDGTGRITGLTDCYKRTGDTEGPVFYFPESPGTDWQSYHNSHISDTTGTRASANIDFCVWPVGTPGKTPEGNDDIVNDAALGMTKGDFLPIGGNADTVGKFWILFPTPHSGGDDARQLWPATFLTTRNETPVIFYEPEGEVNGVFWIPRAGTPTFNAESTFLIGADRYRIFPNGTELSDNSFMCIRED